MTVHKLTAKTRVLVVEDEPSVRRITRSILEYGGYEVLEAADGAEALETLEALCADVEVVLADVHMPRVDGVTLVSHVTARWPHLPTLLMSARADDARDALAQLGLDVPVLDKPFRLVTLLESVAARLGHALPSAAPSRQHSAAA